MSETKEAPVDEITEEATVNEPKALTEEELKQRRKDLTKFYNEETPLLKKQLEYEETLTKIEVAKMTRLEIMMAKAQILQGPKFDENSEEQTGPGPQDKPQGRKLKKAK